MISWSKKNIFFSKVNKHHVDIHRIRFGMVVSVVWRRMIVFEGVWEQMPEMCPKCMSCFTSIYTLKNNVKNPRFNQGFFTLCRSCSRFGVTYSGGYLKGMFCDEMFAVRISNLKFFEAFSNFSLVAPNSIVRMMRHNVKNPRLNQGFFTLLWHLQTQSYAAIQH